MRFSHFILWISTLLREEALVEISIILSLLRSAILASIWSDSQKNVICIKDDTLEIKMTPWTLLVKVSKPDVDKLKLFVESNVCPLLGSKWSEIRKSSGGKILSRILSNVQGDNSIEELFMSRLDVLGDEEAEKNNEVLSRMAEAVLNLKDSELKETVKSKKKFNFLNWNTIDDLKELIQKLADWLRFFNPNEFNLRDADLCLKE